MQVYSTPQRKLSHVEAAAERYAEIEHLGERLLVNENGGRYKFKPHPDLSRADYGLLARGGCIEDYGCTVYEENGFTFVKLW